MTNNPNKPVNDLWNEADALFDDSQGMPPSPYMKDKEGLSAEDMFTPPPKPKPTESAEPVKAETKTSSTPPSAVPDLPPVPKDVWEETERADSPTPEATMATVTPTTESNLPPVPDDVWETPEAPEVSVSPDMTDTAPETPEVPPSTTGRKKRKAKANDEGPLPVAEDGFIKAKKYRSSIKAFYPHLAIALLAAIVAVFPSLANFLFKEDDLAQLPTWLQEHFHLLITIIAGFVAFLLLVVVGKQKSAGVIKVYGDYLEYKKGLLKSTTVHYADIRTIDVQRCLASMYAPIGDLHIISSREHIIMPNLFDPFKLKNAIDKRRAELKTL